ncbi:hypothetical protein URS_2224 [Acinetobacter ursingii]|nr:hypothetical protein URS_2224 [Acinetobacter ursingii]
MNEQVKHFLNGVCRHERRCRRLEKSVHFLNGVCRHELLCDSKK